MCLRVDLGLRLDLELHLRLHLRSLLRFMYHLEMVHVMITDMLMMQMMQGGLPLELILDLLPLLHKQLEEVSTPLLHVFLIFVDKDGLHNQLIESMQILQATFILSHLLFM